MATGSQSFDEDGEKRYEAVRALDESNGNDVPGSDLTDNERETSDNDVNDNFFGLNVVNVSIFQGVRDDFLSSRSSDGPVHPENPSPVKSGDANAPVLREHWKPQGLLIFLIFLFS